MSTAATLNRVYSCLQVAHLSIVSQPFNIGTDFMAALLGAPMTHRVMLSRLQYPQHPCVYFRLRLLLKRWPCQRPAQVVPLV